MNTKGVLCAAFLMALVLASCGSNPTVTPAELLEATAVLDAPIAEPTGAVETGAGDLQPPEGVEPWAECSTEGFAPFVNRIMPLWEEFWTLTAQVDEEFLANNSANALQYRDQAWDLTKRLKEIGYPTGTSWAGFYASAEDSFAGVAESLDTALRMGNEGLVASTQFRESLKNGQSACYLLEYIYWSCGGPEPGSTCPEGAPK
jgi:hypothetical protein